MGDQNSSSDSSNSPKRKTVPSLDRVKHSSIRFAHRLLDMLHVVNGFCEAHDMSKKRNELEQQMNDLSEAFRTLDASDILSSLSTLQKSVMFKANDLVKHSGGEVIPDAPALIGVAFPGYSKEEAQEKAQQLLLQLQDLLVNERSNSGDLPDKIEEFRSQYFQILHENMLASSEYLLYKELARNHWKKFRLQCVVTVGIALLIFSLTKSCKEETNTQDTWDSSDLVVIDTSLEES